MTDNTKTEDNTAQMVPPSRDEIRAKIFGSKPKSVLLDDFFGVCIELRQPSLGVALSKRDESEENRVYTMLADYAFVPGTNEQVFEAADIEQIKELPFGAEFQQLITQINKLLGIDPKELEAGVKDAEKSS